MKREMICISCPIGCRMTVEYTTAEDIKVTGNSCPRGIVYAKNEIISPKRVVTTTVKLAGGGTVAVKTDNPAPKGEIFDLLERLKGLEVTPPITTGQILVKDICQGVNMVATADAE